MSLAMSEGIISVTSTPRNDMCSAVLLVDRAHSIGGRIEQAIEWSAR